MRRALQRFLAPLMALAPVLAAARLAAQCQDTKPIQTVYLEIAGPPSPDRQLSVLVTEPGRQTRRVAEPRGVRWAFQLTQPAALSAIKVEPSRRAGFMAVPQGRPWLEPDKDRCVAVFPFSWEEVWTVSVQSEPAQLRATSEFARNPKVLEHSDLRTDFTVKDIPADGTLTLRLHASGGGESWPLVLRRDDFTGSPLTLADVRRRLCAGLSTPNACTNRMMRLGARNFTLSVVQRQ